MNAQLNFDQPAAAPGDEGLPMPRATLETLERARDRSLAALLAGFDGLAAGMDAAKEAAQGFGRLDDFTGKRSDPSGLSERAVKALLAGNAERGRYDVREDSLPTWREVFQDETRKTIDRAVWSYIVEATDLEKLMDHQAREEFRASLASDPPAPTVENVRATLSHYCAEAPTILKRGIAKAFSGLDRRFKSHDGFKIGSRVILDRLFSADGFRCRGGVDEKLRDIERAFSVLDGKEMPAAYAGIVGQLDGIRYSTPRPVVIESDWVRIRVFKNGNAHLWFTRDDLVRKVNRLLADYYGETIGEGSEVCDVSDLGPSYHLTPARNLGFYETNEETAARLLDRVGLAYLTKENPGLRVLEPSAGMGALADAVRKECGVRSHCVEVDAGRAAILRSKGYTTTQADFLTLKPTDIPGGLFDVVVMNPPFDRGRDCDHVRHALQFLKPGGRLVAIMSASAEISEDSRRASFRAHLLKVCEDPGKWWSDRLFQDLPEGSFAHAGTMVNTVTLSARKRQA